MFVVTLKFSASTARASALMEGHNAWIKQGFDDGIFLLAGSLLPRAGGAVLAHNTSRTDLEMRLQQDPFVAEGVVSADIFEIAPGRTDDRLAFLRG
ncbi:YciI family protein [Rhizobium bangladeshense]|uniref:YciI family protein n=1 Tax=Rhizobium bangladeshense TaxID=1138189 RepID=UPI0007E5472C|nr:YciI family protein [Rhizobium bangladeshense]